jgi:hypothetical protein
MRPTKVEQFHLLLSAHVEADNSPTSLVLIAGISLGCSEGPLAGDTSFREAKKGFEKEMTPAQRKAAIKDLQTQTNWQAQ